MIESYWIKLFKGEKSYGRTIVIHEKQHDAELAFVRF